MRFRLFPNNLEGVGQYRIRFPYHLMELIGGHSCYTEFDTETAAGSKSIPLSIIEPKGDMPDGFAADVYVLQYRMERFWRTGDRKGNLVGTTDYGWPETIDWLHEHGKIVVSEIDDLIVPGKMPLGAPGQKAVRKRPDLSYKTLRQVIERSDILTVSTPALARYWKHPRTYVLPNYLYWPQWENVRPSYEKDRRLRIGWMGVAKWRGRDLDVLKDWLPDWLRRHPDVEFVSVGGPEPHDILKIPRDQRRTLPWRKFPGHIATTQEIDIGLVPLELTHFNQCKSDLKGVEYGACGIPCIASPTAEYQRWVEPDVNGFLAGKPDEWVAALEHMLADDTWRVMGAAARRKAETRKIQDHWHLWEESILGQSPHRRPVVDEGQARVHQARVPVAA